MPVAATPAAPSPPAMITAATAFIGCNRHRPAIGQGREQAKTPKPINSSGIDLLQREHADHQWQEGPEVGKRA